MVLKMNVKALWIYVGVSILFVIFLGFIDEGNYNFRWITDTGSWIALAVYALAILLGELLVSEFFLKRFSGMGKVFVSALGGILIGVIFVVTVLYINLMT